MLVCLPLLPAHYLPSTPAPHDPHQFDDDEDDWLVHEDEEEGGDVVAARQRRRQRRAALEGMPDIDPDALAVRYG